MGKYFIIVIYMVFCFTSLSCDKTDNFGELHFISLKKQTVVNVSCEQLKKDYSTEKKYVTKEDAKKIISFFKSLKKAEIDWNVNARVYGFVGDKSERINFCMGNNIIKINEQNYFVSNELRQYIIKITATQ